MTAGQGEPLVFLHGAGTWHGFAFALPWARNIRVVIPFHPGFAESGDDPGLSDMHDYVLHYLDLFDALGIDKFRLVGFSLGGLLAAKFAVEHGHRVERLVLVGPAGLRGKERPTWDVLSLPPDKIPSMLVTNFDVIKPYLPEGPWISISWVTVIAKAARSRGFCGSTLTISNCTGYLHRLTMPTLLVWGEDDRSHPGPARRHLARVHPKADIQIFKGAGHLVLDEKREAVDAVQRFLS